MSKRVIHQGELVTREHGLRRRQFLRGLGGTAIALPFLRSLLPREAAAHAYVGDRRFVGMMDNHGGIWPQHTYPPESSATNALAMLPGWDAHWGPLALQPVGDLVEVCPVVRAEPTVLTESLVAKMMFVRGLDVFFWMGHGNGRSLGNFTDSDYEADDPPESLTARPTIDQVMAWSPNFYPDLDAVTVRSIHLGRGWDGNISWGYSNPADQSGEIIPAPTVESSLALFESIFPTAGQEETARPLVVDRVMQSYQQLKSGAFGNAARLSADDRRRLDDHMDRLDELQRKLEAASCSGVVPPTMDAYDAPSREQAWSLYNDVIATAFMCGTSRIVTIRPGEHWYDGVSEGDWHQEVAHLADVPTNTMQQDMMVESARRWFRHVLLDLAQKLDVEEADGLTYLDNSLLMYTTEAGTITHTPNDIAVITIGGAGGYLNTGRYYDYRKRDDTSVALADDFLTLRPGVSYNQWLATVLLSMGLPASEWERPGERGYGGTPGGFDDAVLQQASDPLPGMEA